MPELRISDQLKAWLELLSYCAAKPKEFSIDEETRARQELHGMSDSELVKLVREKIPALEKSA